MQKIEVGNEVAWTWGRSKASDVGRKIKDRTIKRRANADEPAFLIRQKGGDGVLESQSEPRKTHG